MDKIYLILQRGVQIHCGSLILIFGLYAGIPIFRSFFPCRDDCGESHLIFFIVTIFAAQGLFLLINWKWKRVSEERCRAALQEFNGKCEYQSTLYIPIWVPFGILEWINALLNIFPIWSDLSICEQNHVSVQEQGLFLEWIINYNLAFSASHGTRRRGMRNIVSGFDLKMNGPKRQEYWEGIQ